VGYHTYELACDRVRNNNYRVYGKRLHGDARGITLTNQGCVAASPARPYVKGRRDLVTQRVFSLRQFVLGLEIHPHLGGSSEIACEPHGGISGDPTLTLDDRADAVRRNAQRQSQRVHRQSDYLSEPLVAILGALGHSAI
jgi:hypothetical protein